jgi:putative ABC transport system substrate-binding protein
VRAFIAALAAVVLTVATPAAAQQKVSRVGVLFVTSTTTHAQAIEALRASLRELGYVDGRNVVIDIRSAEGRAERLPELAAELLASKVDVIVTGGGNVSAVAARNATTTVPIVMGGTFGAVEAGLIESLARPGGNVTGLTMPREIGAKHVDLLRELIPSLSRLAVLLRGDLSTAAQRAQAKAQALEYMNITVEYVDVKEPEDIPRAFAAVRAFKPQAMLVGPDPLFFNHRTQVIEFARTARLPTGYPARAFVDAGGLFSYSLSLSDVYREVARYVDRILKGAKPGDLPVVQPSRFELVLNAKTAKSLGLTVPQSILLRADHVVQ